MIPGVHSLAETPISADVLATISNGPSAYNLATRTWISAGTDNPPYTMFKGRVISPLAVDRSIPITPDAARRVLLQLGDMTLMNADGELDDMVRTRAIDGRRVEVRMVSRKGRLADSTVLFKGTAAGWTLADPQTLRLALRDGAWELITPIQENLYGGTGVLDGTEDLTGKPKPKAYGEVYNIRPVLVHPLLGIRQFNDGPAQEVMAVYDAGEALTFAGSVADIVAAAAPAPGTYITQVTGGYIRTTTQPLGEITADVKGDAPGGVYINTVAEIAYRLIRINGRFPDGRIAASMFETLLTKQPAPVGFYTGTDPVTIADALDLLLGSIGGWWGPNRAGSIEVDRFDLPTDRIAARLDERKILSLETGEPPESVSPAVWRVVVGYRRNWTVLDPSAIAGIVKDTEPNHFSFLTQELREATYEDVTVRTRHLMAKEMRISTLFVNEADAKVEAERLGVIWGVNRFIPRIDLKTHGMMIGLGRTIEITFPRYGFERGVRVVVVGNGIDAENNASFIEVFH